MESRTARRDRPALARSSSRRGVPVARGRGRHPHHSTDARPREHSADSALLERDGRGTQERTGGELEERRPTASPGVGKLIGLVWFPNCPRFVPGNWKFWLRGRDLNPRPLGYEPNELPDCSTPRQGNPIVTLQREDCATARLYFVAGFDVLHDHQDLARADQAQLLPRHRLDRRRVGPQPVGVSRSRAFSSCSCDTLACSSSDCCRARVVADQPPFADQRVDEQHHRREHQQIIQRPAPHRRSAGGEVPYSCAGAVRLPSARRMRGRGVSGVTGMDVGNSPLYNSFRPETPPIVGRNRTGRS